MTIGDRTGIEGIDLYVDHCSEYKHTIYPSQRPATHISGPKPKRKRTLKKISADPIYGVSTTISGPLAVFTIALEDTPLELLLLLLLEDYLSEGSRFFLKAIMLLHVCVLKRAFKEHSFRWFAHITSINHRLVLVYFTFFKVVVYKGNEGSMPMY